MGLDRRLGENGGPFGILVRSHATHRILHGDLGVQQDFDGIRQLILHSQVRLDMQQIDERIGQGGPLLAGGPQHIAAHHDRVVVEECHEDVDARRPQRRVRVLDGKGDDREEAVGDEIGEQIGPRGGLQVLRDAGTLVEELHGILLAFCIGGAGTEDGKQFSQKLAV